MQVSLTNYECDVTRSEGDPSRRSCVRRVLLMKRKCD